MTLLSKISGAGRALAVALVVGAGAMSAVAPVQAQGFGIQVGPGGGGVYVNPGFTPDRGRDRGPRCDFLSDREIERNLRDRGYRDISVRGRGPVVDVTARQDGRYYSITFDACRGRILERERIRR